MLNFIAIIFVFSVIVVIHELGHFLAARWMGVRVEKFSIGFPPSIFSKKIGETTFSIGAIPLGGFVKMAGFVDESMDTETTGADYEFNSKPVWRRIVIIVAGVVMNMILAVFIMATLNYVEGEKTIPYTTIDRVGTNGIASKIGFQKNDKILEVNGQKVSSWNELHIIVIKSLGNDINFLVEREGNELVLNYKKEWFKEEGSEQLDIEPVNPARVGDIIMSMPAAKIGLQRGDEIVNIAGYEINDWYDMTEKIRKYPDQEIEIQWLRDGELLQARITPQSYEETTPTDEVIKVGRIGIGPYYDYKEIELPTAIKNGFTNTYDLIEMNVRGLFWWITGQKSAKEILGGPIMIAKMAGDAAKTGWKNLWYLIAALNAMLAFFNILPIPALDGGHLFFLVLEGIMGRPLSTKARMRIQQVGMAILLTFLVFIIYVDLNRLLF